MARYTPRDLFIAKTFRFNYSVTSLDETYRLQLLVDFIRLRPSLFQVVPFLSENVCPFGELAAISTAKLRSDGWIVTDFQHGFHEHTEFEPVTIDMDAPGAQALRHLKLLFANRTTLKEDFKDTGCNVPYLDNETGIYFPTSPTRLFRFAMNGRLEKHQELLSYYECVRSVLILWENLVQIEKSDRREVASVEPSSNLLTVRQEKILELLRDGMTNAEIAKQIGFSDSLVKQETILIYKKLGVSGRKDLVIEVEKLA